MWHLIPLSDLVRDLEAKFRGSGCDDDDADEVMKHNIAKFKNHKSPKIPK